MIPGLTRRPGVGVVAAWSGLRSWAEMEELDVIVTNSATASALVRTARLRVPVVYFCHGLHWNTGRRPADKVWQWVEQGLLKRTAGVIAINSDDHSWFADRFASEKLLRLHTGVGLDLEKYPKSSPPVSKPVPEPATESATGPLELVWIGEFSPRKRPNLALDTAHRLRSLGLDFRLKMLGEGEQRSAINDRIRTLGLEKYVSAQGKGPSAEALAAGHALVHTATWEGLPRVMMEGLAVGRRTYAFDVKGVRDIPEAVLIADGDTNTLAERIAADWRSRQIIDPLSFDRAALDSTRSADAVRVFLEVTTERPDSAFGGGDGRPDPRKDVSGPSPSTMRWETT